MEEEVKVVKNNAKTSFTDLEYQMSKRLREMDDVKEQNDTLRDHIEQLEQDANHFMQEKNTLQTALNDLQIQFSGAQQKNAELEREITDLKIFHEEETDEWRQFQADLQKAVVIANDIKMETQEDFDKVLLENMALRDRNNALQSELDKVTGNLETLKSAENAKENGRGVLASSDIRGRVLSSVDRELATLRQGFKGHHGTKEQKRISVKNLIQSIEEQVKSTHTPGSEDELRERSSSSEPSPSSPLTPDGPQREPLKRRSSMPVENQLKSVLRKSSDVKEPKPATLNRVQSCAGIIYEKSLTDDAKSVKPSTSTTPEKESPSHVTCTTLLNTSNILRKNSVSDQKDDPLATLVKQTGGSKRNALLKWCQSKTVPYKGIDITNFSSSWNDGLAFCALLHTYLPKKIPYDELNSQDKKRNFTLAFKALDSLGIQCALDINEMATTERPDWQAVMEIVKNIFKHFES